MRRPAHTMMIIVVAAPMLLATVGPASALSDPAAVDGGATLLPAPVRPPMHDEGLRVLLRGSPDPSSALAKLRVVDETGEPIRRAVVNGAWSRNGDVIIHSDKDRTDRDGRAKLRYEFGAVFSGEIIEFCITRITHDAYEYDRPRDPSCASVTVPG